jgi:tetratricopeptide (TPR) repeat protein
MKQALGLDLRPEQVAIASATQSSDAYDLYLRGRALILARADMLEAIGYLEKAVAIDPMFAKAWEVLGAAYFVAPSWNYEVENPYEHATTASKRALELDPKLALPWSVLGQVGRHSGELSYETSLEYAQRALDADPNGATVHLWAALSQAELGYVDRAIPLVRRCLEIDPAYGNCRRHLAFMEYLSGREEEALRLFQQGTEQGFRGNEVLFLPLILRNQGRTAAAYAASSLVTTQGFPVGDLLDQLEYPDRDHTAARQRFRALAPTLSWANIANQHVSAAMFGQYDLAQSRVADYFGWIWSPDLAAFRRSPEFKTLAQDLGLVDYWRKHGYPPSCEARGENDFACR